MKRLTTFLCLFGLVFGSLTINGQNEINGYIRYHNNPEYPLPDVLVELHDMNGNLIDSYLTGDDGFYSFQDLPEGEFTIHATTSLEGPLVTIENAVDIVLYLAGLIQFDAYQFMAADVTGNGVVNMQDFRFIVVNYLAHGQPFPAGDWQFDELLVSTFSRDGEDTLSSGGTKTGGGTSGVWHPTGRDLIETISLETDGHLLVEAGEMVSFPVTFRNSMDIGGYLLSFGYNAEVFQFVEAIPSHDNVAVNHEDGQIKLVWLNEAFDESNYSDAVVDFTFMVIKENSAHQGTIVNLNAESHMVDRNGDFLSPVLFAPEVAFKLLGLDAMFTVSPNPAIDYLNIGFEADAGAYEVKLINLAGQVVKSWQISSSSRKTLYIGDLVQGIYQLQAVESASGKVHTKRIFVR